MSTNSRYPLQPVFKPRGRRVTYHQVDALFDFLIAHQELAIGYSNSTAGRYRGQKAWETVAGILNRVTGGARKDAKGWSAFWSNYKNKLKRRVRLVRAARKNDQEPTTKLTELDIKVLPVLGPLFGCGSLPSVPGENSMKDEYSTAKLKSSPPGSPAPPSSPDTLPSPPSPAPAPARAPVMRPKRRRPARQPSPSPSGSGSEVSGGRSPGSLDISRLYSQAEDRTAAALLRVAAAIETLAEAAQAQAAAARATAAGMETVARAVTEALSKRYGTADGLDNNKL